MGGREDGLDAARCRANRARRLRGAVAIGTRSNRAGLSRAQMSGARPGASKPSTRSLRLASSSILADGAPQAHLASVGEFCSMASLRHSSMVAAGSPFAIALAPAKRGTALAYGLVAWPVAGWQRSLTASAASGSPSQHSASAQHRLAYVDREPPRGDR